MEFPGHHRMGQRALTLGWTSAGLIAQFPTRKTIHPVIDVELYELYDHDTGPDNPIEDPVGGLAAELEATYLHSTPTDHNVFVRACARDDVHMLRRIMRNTPRPQLLLATKGYGGQPVLHVPARMGYRDVIASSLDHDAPLKAGFDDGWIPLKVTFRSHQYLTAVCETKRSIARPLDQYCIDCSTARADLGCGSNGMSASDTISLLKSVPPMRLIIYTISIRTGASLLEDLVSCRSISSVSGRILGWMVLSKASPWREDTILLAELVDHRVSPSRLRRATHQQRAASCGLILRIPCRKESPHGIHLHVLRMRDHHHSIKLVGTIDVRKRSRQGRIYIFKFGFRCDEGP